jgi:hypothetical protein
MSHPHVIAGGFILFVKICLALLIGAALVSSGHGAIGGIFIGAALVIVVIALGIISLVS